MAIAAGDTVTLKNGCCQMMTVECILTGAEEDSCCNQCKEEECKALVRCVWCEGKRTRRENFTESSLQKWVMAE